VDSASGITKAIFSCCVLRSSSFMSILLEPLGGDAVTVGNCYTY